MRVDRFIKLLGDRVPNLSNSVQIKLHPTNILFGCSMSYAVFFSLICFRAFYFELITETPPGLVPRFRNVVFFIFIRFSS